MLEHPVLVKLRIKNERIEEELGRLISSFEGFQLQDPADPKPSDLLILEIGDDPDREFQSIHSIHASGEAQAIFVTSSRFDADLLVQALRAGVKEFLSQPIKREELIHALSRLKEQKPRSAVDRTKRKRGRLIYVIGGKGGVGTTTVAVNLSTSLAQSGRSRSVVLMDMNLLFGEIPIFLDIQSDFSWGEVVKNISRVDATYLSSILVKHPSGVSVLPSPTGLDGANLATPEIIIKLLEVMRESFDFVVIDGGQSLDDVSLQMIDLSDTVLLVAILSLPCLTNVKRLLWTFQKLSYVQNEKVRIVINRYHKKSLVSLEQAERSIGQKIFWQIPNDFQATMSAINQGKTLSSVASGAEITKNFQKLASALLEEGSPQQGKGGLWGRLKG